MEQYFGRRKQAMHIAKKTGIHCDIVEIIIREFVQLIRERLLNGYPTYIHELGMVYCIFKKVTHGYNWQLKKRVTRYNRVLPKFKYCEQIQVYFREHDFPEDFVKLTGYRRYDKKKSKNGGENE